MTHVDREQNLFLPPIARRLLRRLFIVCLSVLGAGPLAAQTLDYGSFEAIFGEPVTMSANGTAQRASEVAATMDIVTADAIRRSGARTIPAILRRLAGVHFRQYTSSQQEVSIRGYAGPLVPRVMVLLNGRPVYITLFGNAGWDQIPVTLSEIRQIEVVRGPAAALFGFNAVAGAINIVTYTPGFDRRSGGELTFSDEGDIRAEAFVSMPLSEKLSLRLSTRFSGIEQYGRSDGEGLSFSGFADSDTFDALGELVFQPNRETRISLEGSFIEGQGNSFAPNHASLRSSPDTWSVRLRGSRSAAFGEVFAEFFINDTGIGAPDLFLPDFVGDIGVPVSFPADGPGGVGILNERLYATQAGVIVTRFDDVTLRLNGEYRHTDIFQRLQFFTPTPGTNLGLDIVSGSFLIDWQASETFRLSATARYDHQQVDVAGGGDTGTGFKVDDFDDTTYQGLSLNVSAMLQLDENAQLRLSVGRGIRVPSAAEIALFAAEPQLGLTISGNPDYEETVVEQIELSFERRLPTFEGKFRATIFYQENDDIGALFGSVPQILGPGSAAFLSQNVLDSNAFGVELELSGRLSKHLTFGANYSFIDLNDSDRRDGLINPFTGIAVPGARIYPTDYEAQVSNHQANLWLDGTWGPWEAGVQLSFASERQEPGIFTFFEPFSFNDVEAQLIVDARAAYEIRKGLAFEIRANGITNKAQRLNGVAYFPIERRFWTGFIARF